MRRADVICACKETTFRGMTIADRMVCSKCGRTVYLVSFNPPEADYSDPISPECKLHARVLRVYESQA